MVQVNKGTLLISEPFIKDPAFGRSVILLVEKNNLGTVGFVLNQKLKLVVSDVLESLTINNNLFNGGPVAHDSLHFILRSNQSLTGSTIVMPGLFWGGDFNELIEKVNSGIISADDLRFFIGYSGWEPGQLESELEYNTWAIAQADLKTVFEKSADKLWNQSMKSLGGKYALMANSPRDPKLN